MRLGLVGIDNTHADHAVRHLNGEHALGSARVVAIQGGTAERAATLSGGAISVVSRPEDLIGLVDAAIVMDRDGSLHRAHAVPLLKAGIPVLVDKPLATTVADAEAILEAARTAGVPVTSYSALRWVDSLAAFRARVAELGPLTTVVATGPVQRDSVYGGVSFYGVHAVELALHLLTPSASDDLTVSVLPGGVVATARVGGAHAVINLVERTPEAAVPFHLSVTGVGGVAAETITLGKDYTLPALRVFLTMLATGTSPLTDAELLAPVHLLETISTAVSTTH
ncbi:Gfo/Idh/MocA family protein [Nonomuraea sp. NPDC050556]|uniref:Gfo/Idh/MocA family protein n=1 Tax=Nonomuraea sp. NPDC050556 TaxID=3364369 RepID=UPI0037BDD989